MAYSIDDWLGRNAVDSIRGGVQEQGGVFGFTLCEDCNSRTGRLSTSYLEFAAQLATILREQVPPVEELNRRAVSLELGVELQGVHPGAFARQLLSLMFSLSAEWGLAERYPTLVDAVLSGTETDLPEPLALGVALCPGPYATYWGPSLRIDPIERSWCWSVGFVFPPLGVQLRLAASSPPPPSIMCEVGGFLGVRERTKSNVELRLVVGMTNAPLPGDWRTLAQVEGGMDLDGSRR